MRSVLAAWLSLLMVSACASETRAPEAPDAVDAGAETRDAVGASEPEPELEVPAALDAGPAPLESVVVLDDARISSQSSEPNFHRARGVIDFGAGPIASARMIVELRTTCFPFESASRPPPGQSWPADCDAFDRNFEISLDPPRTATNAPALELVRAITPFGGPLDLDVDVTDVANGLPGPHTLEVLIPTWSDANGRVTGSNGGWNVSVRFELTRGPAPRRVLAVVPLANLDHGADTATATYAFETPPGDTTSARIEYRVTGHGGGQGGPGCIGPAEEFCRRQHQLLVDQVPPIAFEPWRTDCAELCTLTRITGAASSSREYCAENPCGDPRSVRAPRANWCPGSMTPPFIVEDPALLAAGRHTFSYRIDRVNAGGSWRVTATFIALGAP